MRGIPLTRVSQCFPFVKFLNQIGSPTEKLLKQVGLPFFEVKQSNSLIPEYSVWSLVEQAARWEGMEDFGLQVGIRTELEDVGLFAQSLLSSSTLHDTLNKFVNHINWHSSDARFWLNIDGEEAWFCRRGIHSIDIGSTQVELYTLAYMIKVVQQITCSQWQPTKVYLQMKKMPWLYDLPLLSEVRLYFDRQFTAIAFPRHLLLQHRPQPSATKYNKVIWQKSVPANDFSGAIAKTIQALLPYGITNVAQIAKLSGLSTRTLQRRLAQEGIAYSDLLQAVRREKAIELLNNSNLNLINISQELGYSDPGHFSRAFKRWTSYSPRTFRQRNDS